MFQIIRYDPDSYKIMATPEEWKALDAILNRAVQVYDDTELETLLDLVEEENGKLENFEIQIATLTGSQKDYRLWGEEDYELISLVVLEMYGKIIPDLSEEVHKNVYYQFAKLRQDKQRIDGTTDNK